MSLYLLCIVSFIKVNMTKTILIPTDFSVESLNLLKFAATQNEDTQLDVIFLYCSYLSDSIRDLLFYSPTKIINEARNPQFEEALSILKNKYTTTIYSTRFEHFHGFSKNAFENYLFINEIEEVFVPINYQLDTSGPRFDPVPFLQQCDVTITEVVWGQKKKTRNTFSLSCLFADYT